MAREFTPCSSGQEPPLEPRVTAGSARRGLIRHSAGRFLTANGRRTYGLGARRASPAGSATAASGVDLKSKNPAESNSSCARMQAGVVFNIPRHCGQAAFSRCILQTGLLLKGALFRVIVTGIIETVTCAQGVVISDFPAPAAAAIGPRNAPDLPTETAESASLRVGGGRPELCGSPGGARDRRATDLSHPRRLTPSRLEAR